MITIPRFETVKIEKGEHIKISKKTTVGIKDHVTDTYAVILNFEDNIEKNKELSRKIIETIEEFMENDN